jgi:hypothetical protein
MRLPLLLLVAAAPLAASALGAGVALAEGPAVQPDFPLPGYWEMTTKYSAVIGGGSTERRCYGPADVPKLVQPCNHHYYCIYSTQDARDGHLRLKGKWFTREKDGQMGGQVADVAGTGTYSHESLTASASGSLNMLGLSVPATAEISAHRLSAVCPPDAKKG